MLKKITLFVLALLALLLIIAGLLPAEFRVERSVKINAPAEKVFWQIADLNNYKEWNPWSEVNSEVKFVMGAKTKGEGAIWHWKGRKVGEGQLTILKIDENRHIETKVEFFKPREVVNFGFWTLKQQGDSTLVAWAFEGKFSYPFERFMYFFMDDMLGEDFDRGLENLKKRCEAD